MSKESIERRQEFAKENITYSSRRIDLLLITICGGGIYVCLETLKYLSDKSREPHWLIWVAGVVFLFSIVINFIGQFIGKRVNELDYLMCQSQLDAKGNPSKRQQAEIDDYDSKADRYEAWIKPINYSCTTLMVLGLSTILIYFISIF